jgi:hypothetical protein
MRHAKGTIALSQEQDLPMLRQILNSQFITHTQLWRFMRHACIELSRASFCWRVRRLWAHGFVARHSLPMVDSDFVYSIAGPGVTFLETAGALYNGPRNGPKVTGDGASVAHALGLNAIHLDLLRSGQLVLWQTEVEIRSENELAISNYAKHYDAIGTLQLDGHSARFALEYERTPKLQSEYLRIRELFEVEQRIDRFLYLAANSHIHSLLKKCFWGTTRSVYIGLANDLSLQKLEAVEVVDAQTMQRRRLANSL